MLKMGTKDATAVTNLQLKLTRVGYLLRADGVFGRKTDAALKAFQKDHSLTPDGVAGIYTMRILNQLTGELPTSPPAATPVNSGPTPWMDWMKDHVGEKEIPGTKANQFIIDCFKYTSLKNHKLALTDETAWCAALANAALVKNGYKGTNSAGAYSFDKCGTPCGYTYGAMLPIKHKNGSRHITFYAGTNDAHSVLGLGGNQSNSLKVSRYPKSEVWGSPRWPVKQ